MQKQLRFSYDVTPALMVRQDKEKLMRVMGILLDNAIKYADVGGWVEVTVAKKGRKAKFTVRNSGRGIDAKDLPKIFERFYRGEKSRNSQSGSYGLGLAIAKAIITQAKGKIHASSVPNEVTEFSFTVK